MAEVVLTIFKEFNITVGKLGYFVLDNAYNNIDLSPAYYAATILHPRYKNYIEIVWADQPNWTRDGDRNFQAL
jgi:hypothetical protein